jgi:hypothetical protein
MGCRGYRRVAPSTRVCKKASSVIKLTSRRVDTRPWETSPYFVRRGANDGRYRTSQGKLRKVKQMMRLVAILTVSLMLLLGACAWRWQPIYNVDDAMPPSAAQMSPDRMRDLIVTAGEDFNWTMHPITPGHLEATQAASNFSATVDIYYTPERLKILLKSSVNLRQTETTIHAHYNLWVRNLEKGILDNLSAGTRVAPK